MEATELCVFCEMNQTRMYHINLWEAWGEGVTSAFERVEAYPKDKRKALIDEWASVRVQRLATIAGKMIASSRSSDRETAAAGMESEDPSMNNLMHAMVAEQNSNIVKAQLYCQEYLPVVYALIKGKGKGELLSVKAEKILAESKQSWVHVVVQMVMWGFRHYPNTQEQPGLEDMWNRYLRKRNVEQIKMNKLRQIVSVILVEDIVVPMFAGPDLTSEEGAKWLQFAGHPPFFESLRFTYHPMLCDMFKAHIKANGETYLSLVQVVQQGGGVQEKKYGATLYRC